jgi:hypothetical protein
VGADCYRPGKCDYLIGDLNGRGEITLLIAGLLIYNFNMEWWWYGIAGVVWIGHPFPLWARFFD